jgi:hypothetical protein
MSGGIVKEDIGGGRILDIENNRMCAKKRKWQGASDIIPR